MSVTLLCPNLRCKAVLHVPEATRGKMVRCGQCGMHLLVPPKKPQQPVPTSPRDGNKK